MRMAAAAPRVWLALMTLGVGGTRVRPASGANRSVSCWVRYAGTARVVKGRMTNAMRPRMAADGFALAEAIGYRCNPTMERPRRHAA